MTKIWFTSDTHFHHRNILKYEAENRPFKDRDEMDAELIRRWNAKVGKDDVVFHLGDFALAGMGYIKELVSKLNGHIYLLLGNHDRNRDYAWNSAGFTKVFDHPIVFDKKFILTHEPIADGRIPNGYVNIYGHVHGSRFFNTIDSNRICVCVERWNCEPIDYDVIAKQFNVEQVSQESGLLVASEPTEKLEFNDNSLLQNHPYVESKQV